MTSHQSKGQMQSAIELLYGTVLWLHLHLESQYSGNAAASKWGEYPPLGIARLGLARRSE